MCIQFVYINNNPGPDGYKLIVCNNRDERYNKPTIPASFWPSNRSCLSGISNGGTWFGITKTGKVGSVLNVMPTAANNRTGTKPRGPLVMDYLVHSGNARTYIPTINSTTYLPYNLVLIEMNPAGRWQCHYHTNSCKDVEDPTTTEDGIYGFGNSYQNSPLRKVFEGRRLFASIVKCNGFIHRETELRESLLQLMGSNKQYGPDIHLEKEFGHFLARDYSSIHAHIPQHNLGTRSTTLFFATASDQCLYVERSYVQSPGNCVCHRIETARFKLRET